jgi:hypothetical protein
MSWSKVRGWLVQQTANRLFIVVFTALVGLVPTGVVLAYVGSFSTPALVISGALIVLLVVGVLVVIGELRKGQARRAARLVQLAKSMHLAAVTVRDLSTAPSGPARKTVLDSAMETVLEHARQFLEYRVPESHKCANFLVLKDPSAAASGFDEFVTSNMDAATRQVTPDLRRDTSLAGQAIDTMRPVVYPDVRKPHPGVKWCRIRSTRLAKRHCPTAPSWSSASRPSRKRRSTALAQSATARR